MEALAASLGISIAMLVLVTVIVSLLFPVFWVWMLVDALVRDTDAYPSRDIAEKVMWVVIMAIIQPAALVYFFVVWNPARQRASATSATIAPAA